MTADFDLPASGPGSASASAVLRRGSGEQLSGRQRAALPGTAPITAGPPGREDALANSSRLGAISDQPAATSAGHGEPARLGASTVDRHAAEGVPGQNLRAAVEGGSVGVRPPCAPQGRPGRPSPDEDGRSDREAPSWGNPGESGPVHVSKLGHVCLDGICCGCGDVGADDVGLCLTETTGALRNHGFHSKACFINFVRTTFIEARS